MKNIISYKEFLQMVVNENIDNSFDDYEDSIFDLNDKKGELYGEILYKMLKKDTKKIILKKINPTMYKQALKEFVKYGEIFNYPVRYIYQWKEIVITNFLYLYVITNLYGHTSNFDYDFFKDMVFNEDSDKYLDNYSDVIDYLDDNGYSDILDEFLPKFSNGSDLISDYGIEPLYELVIKLNDTNDVNEIIVLINKILDVSHQRSDLSEIFIKGGQKSLDNITYTD